MFFFIFFTDSAIVVVRDPENSFYKDLYKNAEFYDFSKIASYHEFFEKMNITDIEGFKKINKGKLGLWKIENLAMLCLIALKSKQYSILNFISAYEHELRRQHKKYRKSILIEEMRAKGVPYPCMKNISHANYEDALKDDHVKQVSCKAIRSYKHKLYTIESTKVGFHGLDLKRKFIGNTSVPFGYNPI